MKEHIWIRPAFGHPYCSRCDQLELSASEECQGTDAEELTKLKSDVERLKAALEEISSWKSVRPTAIHTVIEMKQFAARALEETK